MQDMQLKGVHNSDGVQACKPRAENSARKSDGTQLADEKIC